MELGHIQNDLVLIQCVNSRCPSFIWKLHYPQKTLCGSEGEDHPAQVCALPSTIYLMLFSAFHISPFGGAGIR